MSDRSPDGLRDAAPSGFAAGPFRLIKLKRNPFSYRNQRLHFPEVAENAFRMLKAQAESEYGTFVLKSEINFKPAVEAYAQASSSSSFNSDSDSDSDSDSLLSLRLSRVLGAMASASTQS